MSLTSRFFSRVGNLGGEGCWRWEGTHQWNGYGSTFLGGGKKSVVSHRVSYELLVGPIPDGLVLDHLCRTRDCVRPSHLEAVTRTENILRGVGSPAVNARKTHCIRGHELSPENIRHRWDRPGRRECGICHWTRPHSRAVTEATR